MIWTVTKLSPMSGTQFWFAPRNAVDPAEAYRAFRGKDVDIDVLMRDRGFPVVKQ